jgi:hypothetical protein
MVIRAYKLKDELELDELECHLTITSIYTHLFTAGIALISIFVLVFGGQPGYAGVVYFLMGPVHMIFGIVRGNQQEKIRMRLVGNHQIENIED